METTVESSHGDVGYPIRWNLSQRAFGSLTVTPVTTQLWGTLKADLVNGFQSVAGNVFTLMTYDSKTGTFGHFTVPVNLVPYVGTSAVTLGVNAAPTGIAKTVTMLEDVAYTFTTVDFGFSDVKNTPPNSLLAVKMTTLPSTGVLIDNTVAVTAGQQVLAADISAGKLKFTPVPNGNGACIPVIRSGVQDDGGTVNGGVDTDLTPRKMTMSSHR